jgi:Ni2+-binding GTPase involved in maturation of urease and hydrogenase
VDLAEVMNVNVKQLEKDLKTINPKVVVVATNCRTGESVDDVAKALGL